jgi:PKD repeat protein
MRKTTNVNAFKLLSVLFILILSAATVSALSLISEFPGGTSQKSIMPGTSTTYSVMGVADQSLDVMQVTAKFYDITTGEKVFLGNLFDLTTSETFFYPGAFTIKPSDYTNLPGSYVIDITAEEWLTNGVDRKTTSQLKLEVIGNRLPVADFTYDPSNPTTLSNVKFTSTSHDTDGSIVKWEWFISGVKFGEGQTITHLFPQAGTYDVTLRVTDNEGGSASATKTVTVTQGAQNYPVADFTYTPAAPVVNQQVTFTSTSHDSDGTIVKEEWDFNNDGTFEITGHIATHSFAQAGNYPVTLRVTDNSNLASTITKTVVVVKPANILPVADFVYTPANPMVDESIVFTSTSYDPDGTIVAYQWYMDSVPTGDTKSIGVNFAFPGTHTFTLTVTDNSGATASKTKQVVVSARPHVNVPPVANFTYTPANPIVNQTVTFTSTSYDSDGTITKEEWDFNNDGTFEITGHTANHVFTCSGSFPVTLRVTDNSSAKAAVTKIIIVTCPATNVPPVANFTYMPAHPVVNESISLTSTSYDPDGRIVKEEWDFNNDGIFELPYSDGFIGSQLAKSFDHAGSFPVSLRVTDNSGAKSTITKTIVVVNPTPANIPPIADFIYSPMNITAGQIVTFTSTSYDPDGYLVSQNWYIDNVFAGSGITMQRNFSNSGIYMVTLTVTDNSGVQVSKTKQIIVYCPVNVPPVADFIYVPAAPVANESITFTSTSHDVDGTIVKEEWDFNNDGLFTVSGHSLARTFATPGNYPVSLKVTDNAGATSIVTKIIVVAKPVHINVPPVANFVYTPLNPVTGTNVEFTSTSYDIDGVIVSYEWFVDSAAVPSRTQSTPQLMSYVFSQAGVHTVTLRVTDDAGAKATVTKNIVIGNAPCPPTAVLRMPESFTVNTLVKMDGSLSSAGCNATITSYKWQIYKKDNLVSEVITTVPNSSYTFASNAEYKVVLTVYNSNNLSDSDEKLVFAGRTKTGVVVGSEDELFVDYYDVVGSDYGEITCAQTFAITATVSNDRNDDIQDLRVTFAIPELGYKIKSQAFDLDAGKTKTITFYGELDLTKEEYMPGEYYAFIGASDTDTIRVKYFPVIIN